MYSTVHRVISKRLYEVFAPYRSKDEQLRNSPISADFVRYDSPSLNLYEFNFKRFENSPDFGYIGKFERFDYKLVREYYNLTYEKTQELTKELNYELREQMIKEDCDPFEKVSVIQKDLLRAVRQRFINEINGSTLLHFSQEVLDMIFYTLLIALYPEYFMRTPLQAFTLDITHAKTFYEIMTAKRADVYNKDHPVNKLFERTAQSMYSKFKNAQNYGYDTRKYFNLYVYSHAIYRYHLANILLLVGNKVINGRSDNIAFLYFPFRNLVFRNLIDKYKNLLYDLVMKKGLKHEYIPQLVLTDVIDYLQMYGLYFSFINKYPTEVDYGTAKPGEEVDKYDINLNRFYSKIVGVQNVDEFATELVARINNVDPSEVPQDQIKNIELMYAATFQTSRWLGFHAIYSQVSFKEDELYFKELYIPRNILSELFDRFENYILAGFNWYYVNSLDNLSDILPKNYNTSFKEHQNKLYSTHPFLTPNGIRMIDTLKNVAMRYGRNEIFSKHKEYEEELEARGEYIGYEVKKKYLADCYEGRNYIPEFYSAKVKPFFVDYVDILTNAQYTKEKYTKNERLKQMLDTIEEVQYRRDQIKIYDYEEDLILSPYHVDYYTAKSQGYTDEGIQELKNKIIEYIKQHSNSKKQEKEKHEENTVSKTESIISQNDVVIVSKQHDISSREEKQEEFQTVSVMVQEEPISNSNQENFKNSELRRLEELMEKLLTKVDQVVTKIDDVTTKLDDVSTKLNNVITRLDKVSDGLQENNMLLRKLLEKVDNLESRVTKLENERVSSDKTKSENMTNKDSNKHVEHENVDISDSDKNVIAINSRISTVKVTKKTKKRVILDRCFVDELIVTDDDIGDDISNAEEVNNITNENYIIEEKKRSVEIPVEKDIGESNESVNTNQNIQQQTINEHNIVQDKNNNFEEENTSVMNTDLIDIDMTDEDFEYGMKRTQEIISQIEDDNQGSIKFDDYLI